MRDQIHRLTQRLDEIALDSLGADVRDLFLALQRGEVVDPSRWLEKAGRDAVLTMGLWLSTVTLRPGLGDEATALRNEITSGWPTSWDAESVAFVLDVRRRVLECAERARLVHEGADQ